MSYEGHFSTSEHSIASYSAELLGDLTVDGQRVYGLYRHGKEADSTLAFHL